MFALNKKTVSRILLIVSAIFWVILLFISARSIDYKQALPHPSQILETLRDVAFSVFCLSLFLYFRFKVYSLKGVNFNELLWNGFVTGALSALGLILTNFTITIVDSERIFFDEHDPYPYFVNGYYIINSIFIMIFTSKTFYLFKRMIMYQKTKGLVIIWNLFEYGTILSVVLNIWDVPFGGPTFYELLLGVGIFALLLSVNVKWVAYLNFRQKLRSIGVLIAILLVAGTLFQHIYDQQHLYGQHLEIHMESKVFFIITFAFIVIYCISSLLVILFNLPTSSVFEQKFGEVYNFQRLSHSIQMGDSEEQIYEVIIDGSMSTVLADACWLEIIEDSESGIKDDVFLNGIEKDEINTIKVLLKDNGYGAIHEPLIVRNAQKFGRSMSYRSIMIMPLKTNNKQLGTLFLLKKVKEGFDKEIQGVLGTFIGQASVSIENSRLVKEAIETERYKEELKIAKSVQGSLLPTDLLSNDVIDMAAISESADEVGGDYYDLFHLDEHRIAVVIGDVSGHGTQAAFNMAQLKGIFQSLIPLNLAPEEFMLRANSAVGRCLAQSSFITLSLYYIDLSKKEIKYARAGHCPTLFYSNSNNTSSYLKTKGLGLGILRNDGFVKHIGTNTVKFSSGDVLLLYTDGIVEARNDQGEEYDYHRLQAVLQQNVKNEPNDIVKNIEENLIVFRGETELDDDYTLVAIKFC